MNLINLRQNLMSLRYEQTKFESMQVNCHRICNQDNCDLVLKIVGSMYRKETAENRTHLKVRTKKNLKKYLMSEAFFKRKPHVHWQAHTSGLSECIILLFSTPLSRRESRDWWEVPSLPHRYPPPTIDLLDYLFRTRIQWGIKRGPRPNTRPTNS